MRTATLRWLCVIVSLLGAGPMVAMACSDAPHTTRKTIQLGIDWVNNECSRGRGPDCADVANSVIRTLRPLRNCPGINPREVDQIVQQIRLVARGTPPAAQREADRRYRDRMTPDPGHNARINRQADHFGCMGNVGTACAAQCAGDSGCVSACSGQNAWRCNQ